MDTRYNTNYPSVDYLRRKARKKIPGFAFDYLDGACNEEINLDKNTRELRDVELLPYYLSGNKVPDMKTELFGHVYDAPFGIAPVGLQGLVWPGATDILAKAAFEQNIPFCLSTVTTSSIERVAELTEGRAWFQLYHPQEDDLRDKLLARAAEHCPVLVLLSDVPAFGYRSKEIKNGLSMPPRMTLHNILQIMGRPHWAIQTLLKGTPKFQTLLPYIPKGMNMHHLGLFMNKTFNGKLNIDKVAALRDKWKGKLVIKGIVTEEDTEKVVKLGLDGIIVSNHGGRQLDAAESSVHSLQRVLNYKDKIKVMIDSGLRTGPDVARAMASGAEFTFMGRSFMYGVGALGSKGGTHTINILKNQLRQVMIQLGCETTKDFPNFIVQ